MSGQELAGVWRLTSCYMVDANGKKIYPFGPDALGTLMLQAGGQMAWAMMRADRTPFKDPNPLDGTPEERSTAYGSYFTYLGTYLADDEQIRFSVALSLFPNWTGTTQVRTYKLDGGQLDLVATTPAGVAHFEFARAA